MSNELNRDELIQELVQGIINQEKTKPEGCRVLTPEDLPNEKDLKNNIEENKDKDKKAVIQNTISEVVNQVVNNTKNEESNKPIIQNCVAPIPQVEVVDNSSEMVDSITNSNMPDKYKKKLINKIINQTGENIKANVKINFWNIIFSFLLGLGTVLISGVQIYVNDRNADTQVELANVQKQKEIAMQDKQINAEFRLKMAEFFFNHYDLIQSTKLDDMQYVRKTIEIAFPDDMANHTFDQLLMTSNNGKSANFWKAAIKVKDSEKNMNKEINKNYIVYIQYSCPTDNLNLYILRNYFISNNYNLQPMENVGSIYQDNRICIKCFYKEDETKLIQIENDFKFNLKFPVFTEKIYNYYDNVKPGTIEVWIPKLI